MGIFSAIVDALCILTALFVLHSQEVAPVVEATSYVTTHQNWPRPSQLFNSAICLVRPSYCTDDTIYQQPSSEEQRSSSEPVLQEEEQPFDDSSINNYVDILPTNPITPDQDTPNYQSSNSHEQNHDQDSRSSKHHSKSPWSLFLNILKSFHTKLQNSKVLPFVVFAIVFLVHGLFGLRLKNNAKSGDTNTIRTFFHEQSFTTVTTIALFILAYFLGPSFLFACFALWLFMSYLFGVTQMCLTSYSERAAYSQTLKVASQQIRSKRKHNREPSDDLYAE
ncbi:hypothetical protein BLNAU_438 [Blattamonas nauphoetae]|uniref:Uncharacterized protein n=1 Tax=Blattamonas nauphoetae TaxID=2049346 RepID=A0ABQ9YLA0_9EUKA|nr:hypothetical protein BLNAU_438 [Blattamonas nauphoetae]